MTLIMTKIMTNEDLTGKYAERLTGALEAGATREIDGAVWYKAEPMAKALHLAYPKALSRVAREDKRRVYQYVAGFRSRHDTYISRDALLMWIRTKPGISYRAMVHALDASGVPP